MAPVPKPQLFVPLRWAPLNILGSWPPAKSSWLKKVCVNSMVLPCKYLPFDWYVLGSHWDQTHSWKGRLVQPGQHVLH